MGKSLGQGRLDGRIAGVSDVSLGERMPGSTYRVRWTKGRVWVRWKRQPRRRQGRYRNVRTRLEESSRRVGCLVRTVLNEMMVSVCVCSVLWSMDAVGAEARFGPKGDGLVERMCPMIRCFLVERNGGEQGRHRSTTRERYGRTGRSGDSH
jgi:hypothetical protein